MIVAVLNATQNLSHLRGEPVTRMKLGGRLRILCVTRDLLPISVPFTNSICQSLWLLWWHPYASAGF